MLRPPFTFLLLTASAASLVSAQGQGWGNEQGNGNGQGNGPPAFVDLPPQLQEKFASDNVVRPSFKDLPIQAVAKGLNKGQLTTRCNGRVVSLTNLEPTPVVSESTTCVLDGQEVPCPDPLVYSKQENDAKITVSMNSDDPEQIETVQVVIPGCGAETFLTVVPGLVTSIPVEAYDEEELSKFVYGDVETLMDGLRNRYLRQAPASATGMASSDGDSKARNGRQLQTGCPAKSIKLALAFDSSYCSNRGGFNNAVASLTTAVAGVAALYEASTCLTVNLGYIEGYCDPSTDVYKPGVDTNLSGCGDEGILDFFQDYWNANRASVDRDLAHFAGGTGLECNTNGCVIGCAYVNVMCTNPSISYGVNYMTFSSNQGLLNTLLAHEIGHNAGMCTNRHVFYYLMAPLAFALTNLSFYSIFCCNLNRHRK